MKIILLATMFLSLSVHADQSAPALGEGAKEGCNPSNWTCDSHCQMIKAANCGLAFSSDRNVNVKEAFQFDSAIGKKKTGKQ